MSKGKNQFRAAGVVALFLSVGLGACTVVEGPSPRPPFPGPGPQFCTREYQPVCGERRGQRQTFGNACEADRAGHRVVHPGECRGESRPPWSPRPEEPRPPRPDRPGPTRPDRPGPGPGFPGPDRPGPGGGGGVSCTMQYDPVCAVRGNSRRTFGNSCEAGVAGYRVVRPGECGR